MGRVVADSFDVRGNIINVERKQQYTNPYGTVISDNTNKSISFASHNVNPNSHWSSITSIYGYKLGKCSKKSDWLKYPFSTPYNTLLDLCDEENKPVSSTKSTPSTNSGFENDNEKEECLTLRVVNEENEEEEVNGEVNGEVNVEDDEEVNGGYTEHHYDDDYDDDDDDDGVVGGPAFFQESDNSYDKEYEICGTTESPKIYRCFVCYNDICHSSHIISKDFWAHKGKAYFVKQVINLNEVSEEETTMRTGVYIIAGLMCTQCNMNVGWKYLESCQSSQRYKVNKFVIEKNCLAVYDCSLSRYQ